MTISGAIGGVKPGGYLASVSWADGVAISTAISIEALRVGALGAVGAAGVLAVVSLGVGESGVSRSTARCWLSRWSS